MTNPLTLHAESLFSKWGFNDGDAVYEWWWDEFDDEPPPYSDLHRALRDLVRTHLLPLIPGEFTVIDVETSHNPIRVDSWRGQPWDYYSLEVPPDLGEIDVAIAADVVVAAARGATPPDGHAFCSRCEKVHAYCECDAFAHLLTHSAHPNPSTRPHPMGE